MENILKNICEINASYENLKNAKKEIADFLPKNFKITQDNTKNIIINPKTKVLITANLEEENLIITNIEKDGSANFLPIGDISAEFLASKSVFLKNGLNGVIGSKPIHLQSREERKSPLKIENLVIDFGFKTKEEAEKSIKIGDILNFKTYFSKINNEHYIAKSLCERFFCAVLIKLLKNNNNFTAAFLTKEKANTNSSKTAAYLTKPEIGIILKPHFLEKTEEKIKQNLIFPIKDKLTTYDEKLLNLAEKVAEKNKISYEKVILKDTIHTSQNVALSQTGSRTIAFLINCKNFWPYQILKKEYMENFVRFIDLFLKELD